MGCGYFLRQRVCKFEKNSLSLLSHCPLNKLQPMKAYAKTQAELAAILTEEMGVPISARTIKRHLAAAREPGGNGPRPPKSLPDGRLDVAGWLTYLREIDWKNIETDDYVPGAPSASGLEQWAVRINTPGIADHERHEFMVEGIEWLIGVAIKAAAEAGVMKGPQRTPPKAKGQGRPAHGNLLASLHAEAAAALQWLSDHAANKTEAEKRQDTERLILNAVNNLVLLPDGKGVLESEAVIEILAPSER
jgi:hypothetical protein